MWTILDNLFLGDREDSGDLPLLTREGVTHVLNCTRELPCHFPDQFAYLCLGLADPDPAFGAKLEAACRFIDEGRRGGKVLVHCTAAVSRSPAVVLGYLCHLGRNVPAAWAFLARCVATSPDSLFLRQLEARFGPPAHDAPPSL